MLVCGRLQDMNLYVLARHVSFQRQGDSVGQQSAEIRGAIVTAIREYEDAKMSMSAVPAGGEWEKPSRMSQVQAVRRNPTHGPCTLLAPTDPDWSDFALNHILSPHISSAFPCSG